MEKIVVSCLESRIDENQNVYSRFLLGPFLSGHAVTVATALRRALLSEVKTIAITALHIQGVTHEFSTVVGIRESVLELSLNFQQIILSTQRKPKSVQIGYLHVQGPAIVHANDLKLPDGIECVNPTQYIATLSTEGLLVVKFLIAGKKSFLKSNTSTLNSKKIKQAKSYSAQLSHSLLSHAEYDPPRVFRLLRNQSLPNGAIARRAIEEANLLRASRHRLLREAEHPLDKSKISSVDERDNPREQNLVLKEQNLVESSSNKVGFLAGSGKPTQKTEAGTEFRLPPEGARTEATTHSVGQMGLEPDSEVPHLTHQRGDSLSLPESATRIDADSNLDDLACSASSSSRTSDEFNSEVCLRTIIPLDPIFTPVYQVNFGIERDDLSNQIRERVIMEVWTNGSIHPRQAINEAALSTMSIFSKLRKTFQLDSHSLALCANSTVLAAGFAPGPAGARAGTKFRLPPKGARASRLHKTKSIVKSGLLKDDATESLDPLPTRAFGSLALSPSSQLKRPEQTEARTNRRFVKPFTNRRVLLAEGEQQASLLTARLARPFGLAERDRAGGRCSGPRKGPEEEQAQARHFEQKGWGLAAGVAHWRPLTRERFARVTQERRVNYRKFALAKPSVTKLDLTNLVGVNKPEVCSDASALKFKNFSSFGFVRSRHPVLAPSGGKRNVVPAIFLQNFGKSHIRGQTFLLEQSFGLKARFFKGHCAVLNKAMYTSDDHTFKRTFLPSFKVVLGRLGTNRTATLTNRPEETEDARLTNRRFVQAGYVPSTTKAIRPSLTRLKPEQNCAGLTKAALLFQLRFCLAGAVFQGLPLPSSCSALLSKNRAVVGLSSPTNCPTLRTNQGFVITRLSEAGQVVQQPKPKPTLFLIKYRTFSFTRNALRLFGCKQEDSSFLLPLAKQLIRVKLARVFTSCLPLMSKKSESSLKFRFTETQSITTVEGSGWLDVKQILLSLAQSALGLQKNSCGSENFAERDALAQNQELRSANGGAIETSRSRRDLLVTSEPDEFVQVSSAAGAVLAPFGGNQNVVPATPYGRQLAKPALSRRQIDRNYEQTEAASAADFLPVASEGGQQETGTSRRLGTFRLSSKGPKSFLSSRLQQIGRRRPAGWPKGGLKLRAPQKRIASSIALRAITPFGRKYATVTRSATSKLWLRSNLKKQFGFFQFASNGLRGVPRLNKPEPEQTGCQRGFGVLSRLQPLHSEAVQGLYRPVCSGFVQGSRPGKGLQYLRVCVNRSEPLTNRSHAVTKPKVLFTVRSIKRSWRVPLDFTTFPLMMTKVPPLCLPSGLVTLISSPSQEFQRPARSVRGALARGAQAILADQVRHRRLEIWPPLGATGTPFRPWPRRGQEQGLKSERAASEVRRYFSAADFFGLNSDASLRSQFLAPTGQTELRSAFQLTTQAETDRAAGRFRLSAQGSKRLSILYSSNLDKMSFLSSDLANLSLSLKTYTFLKKKGKKNIASLLEYSPNTLFFLLNGDEKMFHEIERCLFFLGLPFKDQS